MSCKAKKQTFLHPNEEIRTQIGIFLSCNTIFHSKARFKCRHYMKMFVMTVKLMRCGVIEWFLEWNLFQSSACLHSLRVAIRVVCEII